MFNDINNINNNIINNNTISANTNTINSNNKISHVNKENLNSIKISSHFNNNYINNNRNSNSNNDDIVKYFDDTNLSNPQIPYEYINSIYHNLLLEEEKGIIPKAEFNYMQYQPEINEQMRSILIDWIIDVHYKFNFSEEALYMTVLIIDRYLSVQQIIKTKLQLLGITALLIACKHEEIHLPKAKDFIYITDNAYTCTEVFSMENEILNKMKFNLLFPSPLKFFEHLANGFKFTNKQIMMGKYLMESFLIDIKSLKYKASVISCASAYIVMKFFKMRNYQDAYNRKYYLLKEEDWKNKEHFVKECARDICIFVDNIHKTSLNATHKKFSKGKYEKVAILVAEK